MGSACLEKGTGKTTQLVPATSEVLEKGTMIVVEEDGELMMEDVDNHVFALASKDTLANFGLTANVNIGVDQTIERVSDDTDMLGREFLGLPNDSDLSIQPGKGN